MKRGLDLALLALAVLWLARSWPATRDALHAYPADGQDDWRIANAWLDGRDPYAAGAPLGHPPTTGFWLLPLGRAPLDAVTPALGLVTLALLLLHWIVVARELALPLPAALLGYALTVSASWLTYHLRVAQISELIAFAYVLAWLLLRRGRDAAGGAMLGLACTFKLFPGLMVVMLALARRWRAVAGATAAWLAVAGVMTARLGAAAWPRFFRMQSPIADYWVGQLQNGSLVGVVVRTFRRSCRGWGPPHPAHLAVAALAGLALVGWTYAVSRPALRAREIDLPFAAFSLLSYFLNPWVWEHYDVFLILPFCLVAAALWRGAPPLPRRARLAGWLMLSSVVALLSIDVARKFQVRELVITQRAPHWILHLYEIGNWIPPILILGILGYLAVQRERLRRAA